MKWSIVIPGAALLLGGALLELSAQMVTTQPLAPEVARTKFQIEAGLKIELVAAEPLVQSPAAIAWDEAGRLFAAENSGYPVGPKLNGAPEGKMVELRDSDGDGQVEQRMEFATGLSFPNGLMAWRGGWLVTDAPHLLWLADTNHDGRADIREIWFTGFATNQSTQLRACYPVLGPDGWIYVARGWSGGIVTSPKWPELAAVDLKGGDFRFRPDGSKAEAIGGNAQFGMVLDDVGRRFLTSNRHPIMHAVARPQWWQRASSFYFGEVMQEVSPVGAEAKVYPISADLTTSGFMPELMSAPHAGTFTSACGLHQYFGEALPAPYQGSWFVCEPAQNLVQRQIMTQEGASFRSRRATEGRDFLASSDTWFHPVYATTGPDGALYIADFYRKFIDHPEYLPKEAREKIDFDSGKDRGRIWRIFATKTEKATLTNVPPGVLVAALLSSNIWKRETAHRLILEQPNNAMVAEIARIFEPFQGESKSRDADEALKKWAAGRLAKDPAVGEHLGRARAVSLLHDLMLHYRKSFRLEEKRAGTAILLAAFDPSPSVREAAFRAFQVMSDRRNPIPDVGGETLEMWMSDPNPAVRFHLAYSLGQGDYRRMTDALVAILKRDAADRWTRAVVLSGLKERMHEFAEQWFATEWDDSEHSVALAFEMGRVYGAEDANGREVVLRHALSASADGTGWQAALLSGLLEAGNKQVRAWVRKPGNDRVLEIERHCRTNALDTTLALYQRTAAIRLLGEFVANTSETLLQIVTGSHPKELQIAAARSLVKVSELALPEKVFNQWREMSPELREVFVGYLVSKPERAVMLLDSVERGLVPVWNINANRRQVLLRHRNEAVKERAEKLLGAQGGGDRSNVFEDYKPVLQSKGDALSGRKIFLNICASCHQHGKEGYPVGPDLSGLKNQPAEAVLYHILMPDAEIYAGYENYEVETKAGEQFNGLLVEENDSTIMLVRALGERMSIPRADIARLRTSASSLMPAELEKAMTRQELADLLAFLRSSL